MAVCRDISFGEDIFLFKVNTDQNKSPVHIFPLEDQCPVVGNVVTPLQIPVTVTSQGIPNLTNQQEQYLQVVPTHA